MRLIMLIVVALGTPALAFENSQGNLEPDSLLNWLRITDVEGYRLLQASDQNSHYFAVKIDSEGDLLLAMYCYDNRYEGKSRSTRVTDPQTGQNLYDSASKKHGPDSTIVTYSVPKKIGGETHIMRVSVAYATGFLYPLKGDKEGRVRIEICATDDGAKRQLFDTVLKLPQRVNRSAPTEAE